MILRAFVFLLAMSLVHSTCVQTGTHCQLYQPACLIDKTATPIGVPSESTIYFPPTTSYYSDTVQLGMPTDGQVLILQDVGPGIDADDVESVANTLQAFYNYLRAKFGSLEIAFATFNENADGYRPRSSFSSDVSTRGYLKTKIDAVSSSFQRSDNPSLPNGAVLDAVIDATMDKNLGWRDNSSKIVVVLTRFGYPTTSGFMSESQYNTLLLQGGILPVYCSKTLTSPGKAQFQALFEQTLVGSVGSGNTPANNILNQNQGNWNQLGKHGIDYIFDNYYNDAHAIKWSIVEGAEYVEDITIDSSFKVNITYKWISPDASIEPLVVINFVGYGTVTAHLKTNKVPYLTSAIFVADQGQTKYDSVLAGDDDGNVLTDILFEQSSSGNGLTFTPITDTNGLRTWSVKLTASGDVGDFVVPISTSDGCFTAENNIVIKVRPSAPVQQPTSAPISEPISVPISAPVPPSSDHQLLVTRQDTPIDYLLPANGEGTVIAIVNLPESFRGTLIDGLNRTVIDCASLNPRHFTYIPPAGAFSSDSDTPFTRFFFKVTDDTELSSGLYQVNIIVIPDFFGGTKIINIDEDSAVLVSLSPIDSFKAHPESDIELTLNEVDGILKRCWDSANCDEQTLSESTTLAASSNILFVPHANTFASPYVSFSYKLKSAWASTSTYHVIINVLPVNDPPTIVPLFSNRATIKANETLLIQWEGYDIDDERPTLVARVSYLPTRGSLYRIGSDGSKGSLITLIDSLILPSSPGVFGAIFEPTSGSSGRSYATIAVAVVDPHGAASSNAFVTVSVTPINRPPTIASRGPYTIPVSQKYAIREVEISDPDVNNFDMKLTISFSQHLNFELPDHQGKCIIEGKIATCQGAQNWLSGMLPLMQVSSDSVGEHDIHYVIDDLNNGGPSDERGLPGLAASTKVTLLVVPPSEIVQSDDNQSMTITIAVSSVGAALLLGLGAGLLARKLKKAAPSDDYFSFMNDVNVDAKSNPLYESQFGEGTNPMYTSK